MRHWVDLPYQYDHNGNMTLDPHKELKISYNFLNLPRLMSKHGQAVLATVYDATGRKWRAVRSIQPLGQNNQPTGQHEIETTTYLGGVEWKQAGGEPTRLHAVNASAHGRTAFFVDEATGETRSRLEYYHTDHLGNVRLAFSDLDGNGTITVGDIYAPDNEVVMEQHYYPFGLSQNGSWFATVHPDNAYRYNGKELDEAVGMYDYGARYYDPAIARWGQVDPLADQFANWSPYNYVYNDPISYNDPTGMAGNLRDGITVIFQKDGNISDEDYANYTWDYIQNVMDVWGDKGTGGKITFKFAVGDFDTSSLGENENLVNVGNYGDAPSYVTGDNQEIAYMNIGGGGANTAAHEFGHHMGLADRYLEGFEWNQSSGISNRRTTPIASGEIGDSEYNSSDNLYSSGSRTLTAYQISIANSNAVEKNYQNGRGIVHETKGGSPARTTHYRVRAGKVAGLKFYGKSTRNDMKTHILTKRLH